MDSCSRGQDSSGHNPPDVPHMSSSCRGVFSHSRGSAKSLGCPLVESCVFRCRSGAPEGLHLRLCAPPTACVFTHLHNVYTGEPHRLQLLVGQLRVTTLRYRVVASQCWPRITHMRARWQGSTPHTNEDRKVVRLFSPLVRWMKKLATNCRRLNLHSFKHIIARE